MPVRTDVYTQIANEASTSQATLVAVSKTKPIKDIRALYDAGQRDFGENYVQELTTKQPQLPADIRWHYIGHLQSNKVKYIAPFIHLVHGVDSLKLVKEIGKQGQKNSRVIDCLLQVHIAQEETKFGLDANELEETIGELSREPLSHVRITGLMGMASFTSDMNKVRDEFRYLKSLYDKYASVQTEGIRFVNLSMGMSADYRIALEEGSTMIRVGSLLFGERG